MQKALLENRLQNLVADIDRQLSVIRDEAISMGVQPEQMKYTDGSWVMSEMLLAKAMALNGLASLKLSD